MSPPPSLDVPLPSNTKPSGYPKKFWLLATHAETMARDIFALSASQPEFHICAGSSESGSRTGASGVSGGSGGSLMGAGEGSGGLRICLPTWRNLVGRVSSCEGAVRAFRCKKFANGSRGRWRWLRAIVNPNQRFPIAALCRKCHLTRRNKLGRPPGQGGTIEDEQCQRIGGGHEAKKFRFLLFL